MTLPPNPPGLPENSALDFQRLMAFPLESPARMLIAIERHLHNVREASTEYPKVNLEMARQIADRLRDLLGYAPDLPELHKQWIQAAARYFFLNQDGGHDWESSDGFDDDLQVVECVARAVAAA
ncbi:MAG: hypothetical protein U0931_06815 [Vulcanimicrobiota bacterium]